MTTASGRSGPPAPIDLIGADRDRALDALRQSFTGVYRWHAKRTLREADSVRAIEVDGRIAAAALLDRFDADVAYVYYLFVAEADRRRGFGGLLLEDAVDRFRSAGARVVFAACGAENSAVLRLFGARGFRPVADGEPRVRDGGLGAWGYRRRMWIVSGELLLGLRLAPQSPGGDPLRPAAGRA